MIAREGWSGEIHTKLDESISPWKSLEKSLECLEREAVSLLYVCHDATRISDPSKNFWGPVFEDLKPFSKSFGLALYADQLCFDMISFDEISVVQAPFNILSSCELENRLGEIRQAGKRIYVRSIYSQGALLVPPARISNSEVREAVGAFHLASLEIGVSRDELAFRWAYFHPFVDGLVLGVSSLSEINRVGAWIAAGPLSADELSYTERALDNNRIDIDLRSQQ
jgi:aryl-alcohol dehydrogenase-like predicted oxidoreductase